MQPSRGSSTLFRLDPGASTGGETLWLHPKKGFWLLSVCANQDFRTNELYYCITEPCTNIPTCPVRKYNVPIYTSDLLVQTAAVKCTLSAQTYCMFFTQARIWIIWYKNNNNSPVCYLEMWNICLLDCKFANLYVANVSKKSIILLY